MNQLEPHEIGSEGNDDRLIAEGRQDRSVDAVDPGRLQDIGAEQQDGNRKHELVEEGMDRLDLPGQILLDVNRRSTPQDCGQYLQRIPKKHGGGPGCRFPPEQDAASPGEGEDQTGYFDGIQALPEEEKGADDYHERRQVDQDAGAGGMGVAHAEIDAGKLEPKQEPHHESVPETDVPVEKRLLD